MARQQWHHWHVQLYLSVLHAASLYSLIWVTGAYSQIYPDTMSDPDPCHHAQSSRMFNLPSRANFLHFAAVIFLSLPSLAYSHLTVTFVWRIKHTMLSREPLPEFLVTIC
ncbi:hypothetical protein V1515DRAFT_598537 [Lipomyces mesembrius]